MTPERWLEVERIFQAAVELPPEGRAQYVVEASTGDLALQREVEKLLAQYEEDTVVINQPTADQTDQEMALGMDDHDPLVGRRVGAYEILRELGRGGMGAVYLAARADSSFQRRVAIKLVKRGMDTDFILRRFKRERQILAALDHPNVARLLDAGSTEDGRPYFVMEYVEGKPLYDYCHSKHLSISDRLDLFSKICDAVQYAHQKLIIHRDLKPSNILVSSDGVPKLLDFGIAKLLDPELAPDTQPLTLTMMRLMTVEYASPEQVRGDVVNLLSDVYSLRVILYELLTGRRPYRFPQRVLHDMARVVAEEEPARPSLSLDLTDNVVTSSSLGSKPSSVETICHLRGQTLAGLQSVLSGNLDNITLKTLQKDPAGRYQSAALLREDIQRYLNGQPVSAPAYSSSPPTVPASASSPGDT